MPSGAGQVAFAVRSMTALVSDSATFCKCQSLTALPSTIRAILTAPFRT